MKFGEAFKLMKNGAKVKLPSWAGYWAWENDTIKMHCKDGRVLDIRETEVVDYTFSNVASDEWVVADEENTPVLGGEALFSFGEAVKYLKRGLKVARKGWNGKGMWLMLFLTPPTSAFFVDGVTYGFLPYIQMKTVDNKMVPWLASQTDVLAEDWVIAEEARKCENGVCSIGGAE